MINLASRESPTKLSRPQIIITFNNVIAEQLHDTRGEFKISQRRIHNNQARNMQFVFSFCAVHCCIVYCARCYLIVLSVATLSPNRHVTDSYYLGKTHTHTHTHRDKQDKEREIEWHERSSQPYTSGRGFCSFTDIDWKFCRPGTRRGGGLIGLTCRTRAQQR